MRVRALVGAAAAALVIGMPAAAPAAPQTLLRADGTARTIDDRALPAGDALTAPAPRGDVMGRGPSVARWPRGDSAAATPAPRGAASRGPTVRRELRRLLDEGAIDPAQHDARRAAYDDARATVRRLEGARKTELGAVVAILDDLAARDELVPARLEYLWRMLEANRRWWTAGPLLSPGQRVGFDGSELVWQHYPGQGIHFQVLASFGKLNGLWRGGDRYTPRLARLVEELLPLAVPRAGGIAWESSFAIGEGKPPWVSAMSQATAAQALARAAARLNRGNDLLPVARLALGVFTADPPEGVRVPSEGGEHYLLYSFDPGLRVLNGFVQTLIGLYDLAQVSGEPLAAQLFARGELAARAEVPAHDTGAWSLYSRGRVEKESDLGYHRLVRDFLGELCVRTGSEPYCGARARFDAYLHEPPRVGVPAQRLRGGRVAALKLSLSKVSRVRVRVLRGGRTVLVRGPLELGFGEPEVEWRVPARAGAYEVRVRAVDLAGNEAEATGAVTVLRPRKGGAARPTRAADTAARGARR